MTEKLDNNKGSRPPNFGIPVVPSSSTGFPFHQFNFGVEGGDFADFISIPYGDIAQNKDRLLETMHIETIQDMMRKCSAGLCLNILITGRDQETIYRPPAVSAWHDIAFDSKPMRWYIRDLLKDLLMLRESQFEPDGHYHQRHLPMRDAWAEFPILKQSPCLVD